jgi:2-polyprenyl-6-hydroxyphenyl methylase/3-demethylubiquinone-9 3-methyltransferase
VFEVGCGNGWVAQQLSQRGYEVAGIDPSIDGINRARTAYPHLKLERGSGYHDLAARYGTFPFLLSLEVVEHLYSPRATQRTSAPFSN